MDLITTLNILDDSVLFPLIDIETLVRLYLNSNIFRTMLEKAAFILYTHHKLPIPVTGVSFKDFVSSYDYLRLSERTFNYIGMSQALIRACKIGHVSIVQGLLAQNAPVTSKAVSRASKAGHTEIVKVLLNKRKNDTLWGSTSLAFRKGHTDIINFVLDSNILFHSYDINVCACKSGNVSLVERVRKNDPSFTYINYDQLVGAYYSGNPDMIQYVLPNVKIGLDIHQCALEGYAKGGNLELFTSLLEKRSGNMDNCLLRAIEGGHTHIVDFILSIYQPSLDNVNRIMSHASLYGNRDVISMMLDRGGHVFRRCATSAAVGWYLDIVEIMISLGATNYSAIMDSACRYGHIDIVRAMLERDTFDYSECLTHACEGGHLDIIRFMLDKGADVTDWAIEIAERSGHLDILSLLHGRSTFSL